MEHMNPEKFKSQMHSLAYGGAMAAAARDYQQEMIAAQNASSGGRHLEVDMDDLIDDPELERLHAERLYAMQKEAEKRVVLQRKGHGELQEVEEGQFLQIVTDEERCVCHFFHQDFERCRILDKHLNILCRKYFDTRFIRLSAPTLPVPPLEHSCFPGMTQQDAPFFTVKLQVQMLPCLVFFCNGVAIDRIAGFDELGSKDDFPTIRLEKRLLKSGVVSVPPKRDSDSDDDELPERSTNIRTVVEDEDSDFD